MSQTIFKNPIVSDGPDQTGVGNGTLSVDRLTHFTINQTYTLTCIAKTPDTLFSVVGDVDGSVGLATVGTQFFDEDLKVFLTIQQGSTVFEVGDTFTFEVQQGDDLEQSAIDDYDELPQKNFGPGLLGTFAGDHNLRYSDDELYAYLFIQNLKLTAVTPGSSGDDISIEFLQYTPAVAASVVIQDLTYTADTPGAAGNSITVEYIGDALAGFETVGVLGNAITVHIESGASTATQVKAAVDASIPASALVNVTISGLGGNFQTSVGPTSLFGGTDAIGLAGFEVVSVTLSAITVRLESGVSTATQVKAAIDASIPASALVSVQTIGDAASPQIAPSGPFNLSGGENKNFALNHNELTDPGDFVEGNANLLVRDILALGSLEISGHATFADILAETALTDKVVVSPGTGKGLDVSSAGDMEIGASVGANDLTLGGSLSTVIIPGNLTVQGTQTILNTTVTDVEDRNVTINKGGTDGTAEGSGLTVDRTGADGSFVYENALASRFKIGDIGFEKEIVTVSDTQVITNKDIDGGTASNLHRITLPKDSFTNISALTRKEATLLYASDTDLVYYDNGTALKLLSFSLSAVAPPDVAASGSAGTANGTVANADHTHKGVTSIAKSGDTALYGAVTLSPGSNISLNQVGNNIEISSSIAASSSDILATQVFS